MCLTSADRVALSGPSNNPSDRAHTDHAIKRIAQALLTVAWTRRQESRQWREDLNPEKPSGRPSRLPACATTIGMAERRQLGWPVCMIMFWDFSPWHYGDDSFRC